MKFIKLIFMAVLYGCSAFTTGNEHKRVVNRMAVRWEVKSDRVFFELSIPEHGWAAIGFNDSKKLEGTHLIMATVKDGQAIAQDFMLRLRVITNP